MSDRELTAEEKLLNLIRFMCSDDDGNWDEAAAQELLAEIEAARSALPDRDAPEQGGGKAAVEPERPRKE